jgi:hypothetical protein
MLERNRIDKVDAFVELWIFPRLQVLKTVSRVHDFKVAKCIALLAHHLFNLLSDFWFRVIHDLEINSFLCLSVFFEGDYPVAVC